jgi:hypothetical protein
MEQTLWVVFKEKRCQHEPLLISGEGEIQFLRPEV